MLGSDLSSAPVAEKVGGTAEKTRSPYRWRGWMKSDYEIARRTARANCRAGSNSGWSSRALVGDPSALLAGEPTGSLDFRTGEMIMGLLEDLHRSRQLTSIHVTHNLNVACRADRVVALELGKLVAVASSSDSSSDRGQGRNYV